ncbi:MAG: hypothetical protein DRI90_12755 [Deltaproteobacteria bacterium]|nr:MAG: hypothetical protein DRI90_12755 [Deltaproteobacteria bacterium]
MASTVRPCSVALVTVACALLSACGGSASETPWPVEPLDTEPGPAGEARPGDNVVNIDELPNNYDKIDGGAGKSGKPADED